MCRSSTAIIILHHALMAKADRQPAPCMFTANIAFKETPSFKAPEDGPDISREHSLKGGVFIVKSIESDNNSSHLLASPFCPTLVQMEVFVFDLQYFSSTPDVEPLPCLGRLDFLGEITWGRGK